MAEYKNVEKPFLEKLKQLGWKVIDHGASGIPQNPAVSLRQSFKEVVLKDVFKQSISKINTTPNGKEWLTSKQLEELYYEISDHAGKNLHEANKAVFNLLLQNTVLDRNETDNKEFPIVRFIDFENWENNSFIAINQFRIDTPSSVREAIIPDIVLFVNGMPFVVVECKDLDVAEPLSEAENQIRRYSNRRDDEFGIKEGEERLFHYNLFSIITHGEEARAGTISADFDYYYNWKDIFPEEYKVIDIEKDNEQIQEVLIRGMLNKEILLDVLRHFTLFMEIKEGTEVKIVCRYQQYRAVGKILQRLRTGQTPATRSGVIWHTQGSGKSLTMVFLVRKLRSQADLKDYMILMINDRIDLEDQLTKTAFLTGEKVNVISKRNRLRSELKEHTSNLNMVMIHKFLQDEIKHSKALMRAYYEDGIVPKFKPFDKINNSDRILILIDEAHRTQGGDMGDNLFSAFPNAVKIAFTGTPLLTDRNKNKTHERFGKFIDKYKIRQSVKDRATLDIIYIGRTSKDHIIDYDGFYEEFEDIFRKRTKEERLEIQKRYGGMRQYLENKDRLRKIAEDIVEHYTTEIMVNDFKAQVVASSVLAAARYEYLIKEAIQNKIKREEAKAEKDEEFIKRLKFLDVCTVVSMQENNELVYITKARLNAREKNAVENFKKDFDYEKPETGIAILCVCDRLITGFDAPIEQAMYLDKNLREHDLLQAIARVNRTKGPKKTHGIVVDYFGVAQNLKEALAIYGDEDEKALKEFLEYFKDINKELPILESRYNRLIQLFEDKNITQIKAFVNQEMEDKKEEFKVAEDCIELAEEVRFRAEFDTYLKSFFESLDLLFNVNQAKAYWIPAKRYGYLMMRIRNRYKDETLDLKWAGAKVRKLIDKHLESLGISSKIPPVSLLSDKFPKELEKHSGKAKASEMEHAIRKHIKVNLDKDPELYTKFNERLKAIIEKFKGNWDMIIEKFSNLREEMTEGRKDDIDGLNKKQQPFYGLIKMLIYDCVEIDKATDNKLKVLTSEIVNELISSININHFWSRGSRRKKLEGDIDDILEFCDIVEISKNHQKLTAEILALAKKRHKDLVED